MGHAKLQHVTEALLGSQLVPGLGWSGSETPFSCPLQAAEAVVPSRAKAAGGREADLNQQGPQRFLLGASTDKTRL